MIPLTNVQPLLKSCEMLLSMSRKGNCYINAMMESFFGMLKRECIGGIIYDVASNKGKHIRFFEGKDEAIARV